MNAYQQPQSAGIDWPAQPCAWLNQPSQAAPRRPEFRSHAAVVDELDKQKGQPAAQHEAALSHVCKSYVLPADESVQEFLTEHRAISQVLLAAVPQLKACFGDSAVFNLRAPIDEAGSRTLYAIAMWPGKLRDVREALARFDNEWWIGRAGQAAGYLTFTYELV